MTIVRVDKAIHNQEVIAATQHLYERTIPEFAETLGREYASQTEEQLADIRLEEMLHQAGINCRHLGRVRSHSTWQPSFQHTLKALAV